VLLPEPRECGMGITGFKIAETFALWTGLAMSAHIDGQHGIAFACQPRCHIEHISPIAAVAVL